MEARKHDLRMRGGIQAANAQMSTGLFAECHPKVTSGIGIVTNVWLRLLHCAGRRYCVSVMHYLCMHMHTPFSSILKPVIILGFEQSVSMTDRSGPTVDFGHRVCLRTYGQNFASKIRVHLRIRYNLNYCFSFTFLGFSCWLLRQN
jgi:hypothetical protein